MGEVYDFIKRGFSAQRALDVLCQHAGRPTMEQLQQKLAQAYQIVGAQEFLNENNLPVSDEEYVRALDYLSDEKAFDPHFLPWPRA